MISNGGLTSDLTDGATDYLYSGVQCVEERDDENTALRQYVWGRYVDELIQQKELTGGTPTYYPLSDLLYRTVALTKTDKTIEETYDTDAYGNTLIFSEDGADDTWFTDDDQATNAPKCHFIFTGRRYDPETQIYFYRARYYHPELGRFISRDPVTPVNGMCLYAYVTSRPVLAVDPLGLQVVAPRFDDYRAPGSELLTWEDFWTQDPLLTPEQRITYINLYLQFMGLDVQAQAKDIAQKKELTGSYVDKKTGRVYGGYWIAKRHTHKCSEPCAIIQLVERVTTRISHKGTQVKTADKLMVEAWGTAKGGSVLIDKHTAGASLDPRTTKELCIWTRLTICCGTYNGQGAGPTGLRVWGERKDEPAGDPKRIKCKGQRRTDTINFCFNKDGRTTTWEHTVGR